MLTEREAEPSPNGASPFISNAHEDSEQLQRLASAYIEACEKELDGLGLKVRSAMELEFSLEDRNGVPLPHGLFLKSDKPSACNPALRALREAAAPYSDYIEKIGYESVTNNLPFQYEVNISDPARDSAFHPATVAEATLRVKTGALKKALESTTHYSAIFVNGFNPVLPAHPNFKAFPYPAEEADPDDPHFPRQHTLTSALHDNVSLYDTSNRNLFASSPDLLEHCAQSLVEIQRAAGLAFLPGSNSLQRVGRNDTSPKGLGIDRDSKSSRGDKFVSVSIRMPKDSTPEKNAGQIRLENRLAGADADPLVCQALTLAALVDTVRKHVHKAGDSPTPDATLHTSKGTFRVDASDETGRHRYEIPQRGELIERFASDRHVRELLGTEFHSAILREYGKEKGPSLF